MRRFGSVLMAGAVAIFATACFDIEQDINLKKDMSGTASFKLGIDMEPMILIMAQIQHDMEGKKGPVSKEELAKAKADFKKQQTTKKTSEKPEDPKKEVEKGLPPGVKLLDAQVTEQEFGVTTKFLFGFDKLSHLVGVKLSSKDKKEEGGDPTKKSVIDSPFEGLEVVETPTTLTVRTKPNNPTETVKEEAKEQSPKMDPDTEKMMHDAFKKLRIAYKITAPFDVVSTNATRREGQTLIWEYDLDRMEKMSKAKNPQDFDVKVTYKK